MPNSETEDRLAPGAPGRGPSLAVPDWLLSRPQPPASSESVSASRARFLP